MTYPIAEKLIQRQINHWNSLRKFLPPPEPQTEPPRPMIITVSRETGSGGRQLAEGLAAQLDLRLHDRSLVEKIIRQENLPPALAAELDEKIVSQSALWIKGLFSGRIFLRKEYQHALVKTINALADSVGGVFLGRGANIVLRNRADLTVHLVADVEHRLDRVLQRSTQSRADARLSLSETDRERDEFIAKVYEGTTDQTRGFDLVLNSSRVNIDGCLELVLLALITRMGRHRLKKVLVATAAG